MLLEIACNAHFIMIVINLFSSVRAQMLPLHVTRWQCKNTHSICSPATKILPNSRHIFQVLAARPLGGIRWGCSHTAASRTSLHTSPLTWQRCRAGQVGRDPLHPHTHPPRLQSLADHPVRLRDAMHSFIIPHSLSPDSAL